MEENKYDHSFKILLAGDSGFGKTTYLKRLMTGKFFDTVIATGNRFEYAKKEIIVDSQTLELIIWDMPGQEYYRNTVKINFKFMDGFLLFIGLGWPLYLNSLNIWIKQIREECGDDIPIVLIGILAGDRKVSPNEIEEIVQKYKFPYIEVSVQDGTNVLEAVELLCREIMKKSRPKPIDIKSMNETSTESPNISEKWNCNIF